MKGSRDGESAAPQRSHCSFISRAHTNVMPPPRRVRSVVDRPKRAATCSVGAARKTGSGRTGLSAPRSAAAAPLIGGGKLAFLALGLFSLAVLAPAPDRLGAAAHRDEP